MIVLYMVLSLQKVVVLDDLGLSNQRDTGNMARPGTYSIGSDSSYGTSKKGYRDTKDRALEDSRYHMFPVQDSGSQRSPQSFDLNAAVRNYLRKRGTQHPPDSNGPAGASPQTNKEPSAASPAKGSPQAFPRGSAQHEMEEPARQESPAGSAGSPKEHAIDIDVPYHRDESTANAPLSRGLGSLPGTGEAGAGLGTEPPHTSNGGWEPVYGRDSGSRHTGDENSLHKFSEPKRPEDSRILGGSGNTPHKDRETANSAQMTYIDIRLGESREREGKIADEIESVDESMERLLASMGDMRPRVQKTQIDLANKKNSIKNLVSRKESGEKLARRLGAEARILNNEIVKLNKELDEKKMRLDALNEDLSMQNSRMKNTEDELNAKKSELDNDEIKKNDLSASLEKAEEKMAVLKERKGALIKEKAKENGVQIVLQNERERLSEPGIFS